MTPVLLLLTMPAADPAFAVTNRTTPYTVANKVPPAVKGACPCGPGCACPPGVCPSGCKVATAGYPPELVAAMKDRTKTVLVVFTTSWCHFCRIQEANEKKAKLPGNVTVVHLDADKYPEFTRVSGVDRYPTTLRVVDGYELSRHAGCAGVGALEKMARGDGP